MSKYLKILWFLLCIERIFCENIDPNGYIVYCPCMGRFGNQAEQFLGTIQFAKHLNRTLVLPPFIQYSKYDVDFLPFEEVINVTRLEEYHRVIPMEQFMAHLAPTVWPEEKRAVFCYSARNSDSLSDGCSSHEGNPFRAFWMHMGIESFPAGSVFYSPLHTDYNFITDWAKKYPSASYPVLAFVGAPSSFPTNKKAVQLQRFVHFSDKLKARAKAYGEARGLERTPYLSIHIRHGQDWQKACDLINRNPDLKNLFSSQQCLAAHPERKVTFDLCLPSSDQIVTWIESSLKNHPEESMHTSSGELHLRSGELHLLVKVVYIASDFDNITLWKELHDRLDHTLTIISPTHTIHPDGSVTRHDAPEDAMIDLYLLTHSNLFIGNCVSSFTAFVSRYRIYNHHLGQKTFFFAFQDSLKVAHYKHDEL